MWVLVLYMKISCRSIKPYNYSWSCQNNIRKNSPYMSIPISTCVFCHVETETLERHMGTHNEALDLRYYVHGAKYCNSPLTTSLIISQGATYVLKQSPKGYWCPFQGCNFAALPYQLYKHAKEYVIITVSFSSSQLQWYRWPTERDHSHLLIPRSSAGWGIMISKNVVQKEVLRVILAKRDVSSWIHHPHSTFTKWYEWEFALTI